MSVNTQVPFILNTKFQPYYAQPFRRNGRKCQGRRKFSNDHCEPNPLQLYFILISINIKVLLLLHRKFQPNVPCGSGENADFISFAILISAAMQNSRPDLLFL